MMASILGCSFEAFILDNEMHAHIYRMIRGFEVNDEAINYDAITGAVLGAGHFLGDDVTMQAMQRDYVYPELADRDPPITWAEKGAMNIHSIAQEKARTILSTYYPDYIPDRVDKEIRDRFNILL